MDTALIGRRAQIIADNFDHRFIGITGTVDCSEDGYVLIIEQPLPECCREYDDSRTGRLIYEDFDHLELIDDTVPIHDGQLDGPNPLFADLATATAELLGPEIAGITWADERGQATAHLDLEQFRPPTITTPDPIEAGRRELSLSIDKIAHKQQPRPIRPKPVAVG
jgi:hypothetical protein